MTYPNSPCRLPLPNDPPRREESRRRLSHTDAHSHTDPSGTIEHSSLCRYRHFTKVVDRPYDAPLPIGCPRSVKETS
jgi:hypothetical protein